MNSIYQNIPPVTKDYEGQSLRLTAGQRKRIRSLILRECCNYDSWYKECLGPDRADDDTCSQLGNDRLVCRWMEHAVLPLDPELHAKIIRDPAKKHCTRCGRWFIPGSGRALYCPSCAEQIRKEHKRNSARKRRNGRRPPQASQKGTDEGVCM